LVKDFLAKKNVTTLEQPQYSPDMSPPDFYLFPRIESASKGRRFCDVTDIIENALEELKMISQNGFHEWFQQINSLWQKCTIARWDYFEGT
jgi:hypothetical protein